MLTATKPVTARLFEQWSTQLTERLEFLRDRGDLRPETPTKALATLILAAVEGGAVIDKATGSTRGVSDALDQAYALPPAQLRRMIARLLQRHSGDSACG